MAQTDYYLKIEGIQGESMVRGHENEIDVLSFSWGETQSAALDRASSGHGTKGKVSMRDFTITKKLDKSSPKLILACASGERFDKATLTCFKVNPQGVLVAYFTITFSDVLLSSYDVSGGAGERLIPLEDIKLNFAKVEFEYRTQAASGVLGGPVKASWDLKLNKVV
ncbi:MAG TPA: Hcp family type VI secretion system effector [Pyrinomonadaceae bacterium]|jgi:type VI secretion system secreted protein Hcp